MPGNLRDRLKRIQRVQQGAAVSTKSPVHSVDLAFFAEQGWASAGYLTLRREITANEIIALPAAMPETAGMIMPPLSGTTAYEDLLFFDLETTGLSGGAGTMAFLAAFGRLIRSASAGRKTALYTIHVTQYLLLDYPGENTFVEALLGEFKGGSVIVSFNGRSFDSQILKTRCFMNGVTPPEYSHADLLYPARRLWKRMLPNCSQGTIETAILGIDRTGDIPGAFAPEIWFSFLRNGDTAPLLGIAEHNRRDITGLAAIFSTMARIADDPFEAIQKIKFDLETLSLRYAFALFREGKYDEGRTWLFTIVSAEAPPPQAAAQRILALRTLAIDSEHRLKNAAEAIAFTEQGLELLLPDSPRREEFERRLQRLYKKSPNNLSPGHGDQHGKK